MSLTALTDRKYLKMNKLIDWKERRTVNSTSSKVVLHWFNHALCFVSSSVVADSFRVHNRQLLGAENP
jgi:hypothetical protein